MTTVILSKNQDIECIMPGEFGFCTNEDCPHHIEWPLAYNCLRLVDEPLTQKQIASVLGISRVSVHHIEKRAKRKLKRLLMEALGGESSIFVERESEYYNIDSRGVVQATREELSGNGA